METRPVLTPAIGGEPLQPDEAQRVIVTDATPQMLIHAITPEKSRVHPELEKGSIGRLLEELGVEALSTSEMADRLDPTVLADTPYPDWLDALEVWVTSLNPYSGGGTVDALRRRPVLKSNASGIWASPRALLRSTDGVPPLPDFCHRDTARDEGDSHVALLDKLKVRSLDLPGALKIIRDSIGSGFSDERRADYEATLQYLRELWQINPDSIKEVAGDVEQLPLPARTSATDDIAWRSGRTIYFGADWLPGSPCEALYAPFGIPEFLAALPPGSDDERKREIEMFAALGVAKQPRRTPVDPDISEGRSRRQLRDWATSSHFRAALSHEGCSRPVYEFRSTFKALDRLEQLLESHDPTALDALVKVISDLRLPSELVEVYCRRRKHQPPNFVKMESPDAFLVRTTEWVPLGGGDYAIPQDCWTGILESQSDLVLRRAALRESDAERIGVPTTSRPTRDAIEWALVDLHRRDAELEDPAVKKTAVFLVDQLGKTLARDPNQPAEPWDEPRFPASDGPARVSWRNSAVLGDLHGASELPDVHILLGSTNKSIAEAYDLSSASELVSVTPAPGEDRDEHLLTPERRAGLVAYLAERSSMSLQDLARLVGRLEEKPVASLALQLTGPEGATVVRPREAHVEVAVTREGQANVKRGLLYRVTSGMDRDAGDEIARYIGVAHLSDGVRLFLTDPDGELARADVDAVKLQAAREALAKYTPVETKATDDSTRRPGAGHNPPENGPRGAEPTEDREATDRGAAETSRSDEEDTTKSAAGPFSDNTTGTSQAHSSSSNGQHGSVGIESNGGLETRHDDHRPPADGHRGSPAAPEDSPSSARAVRRDRLISYVLPDDDSVDETKRSGESSDPEKFLLGKVGVAIVKEVEESEGRDVTEMPHNNPGFDLKATDETGTRRIEVKATDGPWDDLGVAMTPTEFDYATEHGGNFWLYVVEYALSDPIVHRVQDPAGRIDRFMFDGGWQDAAQQVAPLPESAAPASTDD